MNFDQLFEPRLELIRKENRYRVFADLERCAGDFPQAFDHRYKIGDCLVFKRLSRHGLRRC